MNPRNQKPVSTIPDGVYEGGIDPQKEKKKSVKASELTTDLQENGYPLKAKKEDKF